MFLHYLKIAWRNILKYKTQSIISVLGLAIGFTAFSFTISWIRYEMGYDNHNPYADRIYCVASRSGNNIMVSTTPVALSHYLREHFPEVAATCNASSNQLILSEGQVKSEWDRFVQDSRFIVYTDTAFFSVFYPETNVRFPHPLPENAAVFSRGIAEKWNITPDKFGQKIDSLDLTPIGIVEDKPLSSNVAFGWMDISNPSEERDIQTLWNYYSGYTYIRLHKGTSIENIRQRLDSLHVTTKYSEEIRSFTIYPLREMHYLLPNNQANITYEALKQFSIVALLVTICALINYIMLFISKVKTRNREFALNKVNGASNTKILLLLLSEFLLVLLAAIFMGGVLTELLFPAFSRFSMIVAPKSYFLIVALWYSLSIIVLSAVTLFILVHGFVRRSIRENMVPETKSYRSLKISFSRISIFVQLCIGVLLTFCTTVVFNQYHLMDQRVGYNRNGLMVYGTNEKTIPVSEIKKIAGIGDFIINSGDVFSWSPQNLQEMVVTGKDQQEVKHSFDIRSIHSNFRSLLEVPLLEGRDILPSEDFAYYINETGNRELGNSAIGKTIDGIPVIGVIPDLQVESPLVKIQPTLYRLSNRESEVQMCNNITFRCTDDSIKKRVHDWFSQSFPLTATDKGYSIPNFYSMDINELFKDFTRSERNLLLLITIMTAVAILIAVFGIYSMITLACNQRRKEIAIRKVNGAQVKEIMVLFFKEYAIVTILSCVVAFPIGVFIMERWLQQYTRRIQLEWWLFVGVFFLLEIIVVGSIIFRVLKAASENPAEVVKSE